MATPTASGQPPVDENMIEEAQGYNDPSETLYGGGALTEAQRAAAERQIGALQASGDTEYDSAITQQQQIANNARDALRTARDRLANEKPDNGPMWLAIGNAMGQPGQTGGFMEGVTNALGVASKFKEQQRQEREKRLYDVDAYGTQLAEYGNEPLATSPDLIQTRINQARLRQVQAAQMQVALLRHGMMPTQGLSPLSKLMYEYQNVDPNDPMADQKRDYLKKKIDLMTTRPPSQQPYTPEQGNLLASLQQAGVPMQSRNPLQTKALIDALHRQNPGKTDQEISAGMADGTIDYKAAVKEAQVAAGTAGKIKYASFELENSIPLARDAISKTPSNLWVAPQKLLRMGQAEIQDPRLRNLQIKEQTVLNAYNLLASRGMLGTGSERGHYAQMLTTADSPEVANTALDGMIQEIAVAKKAGKLSMQTEHELSQAGVDTDGSGGTTPKGPDRTGWSVKKVPQ